MSIAEKPDKSRTNFVINFVESTTTITKTRESVTRFSTLRTTTSIGIVRPKRRKYQPEEVTMAIKGSRGTSVSFHEGNSPKTCIVEAAGASAADMAADMMEVANSQTGYCYSDVTPTVTIQMRPGRIYVVGEGGNAKVVISAMVDAVLLPEKKAQAELTA